MKTFKVSYDARWRSPSDKSVKTNAGNETVQAANEENAKRQVENHLRQCHAQSGFQLQHFTMNAKELNEDINS